MAFTLIVKNSVTAGKVPTASQLEKGELAINLTDHKLYSKGAADEIFEIGKAGETPSGGTGDRPSGPSVGDLYFDTDLDALLYWNGSEWVPIGTEAIALGDLSDVDTTGVADGMVITYDQASGEWKPVSPASLAVDVDLEYVPNGNSDAEITNTAGDNATVPIAIQADSDALPTPTTGTAGLFTGLEKEKLAGIEPGAQVNDGYNQAESDERYLRIDADAPDQTRVAGEATFAELTTHEGGVSVTGGSSATVDYGLVKSGSYVAVSANSRDIAAFKAQTEAAGIGFFPEAGKTYGSGNAFGIEIKPSQTASSTNFIGTAIDFNSNITATNEAIGFRVNGNNKTFTTPQFTGYLAANLEGLNDVSGFKAATDLVCKDGGTAKGFESNLTIVAGKNNYNFYAAGTAPNFFAGDLILDSIKNAPALGTDANGKIVATSGGGGSGSSQWIDTTGGIYYSAGNVGIGTDAPVSPFVVSDSGLAGLEVHPNINGNVTLTAYNRDTSDWHDVNFRAKNILFNTDGSEKVRIDSSGNVGIGTDSPEFKLDVDAQIRVGNDGGYGFLGLGKHAGETWRNWHLVSEGDGYLSFFNGVNGAGTKRMTLDSNGNVGVGSDTPSERLVLANVAEPSGLSDTAISMIRSNYGGRIAGYLDQGVGHGIRFSTIDNASPTERMRINQSGNVGIGTDAPGAKLDVAGDAHIRTNVWMGRNKNNFPGSDNDLPGCFVENATGGSSIFISRTDNSPLVLNTNIDTNILRFRKGGTEKGSITINDSDVYFTGTAAKADLPLMHGLQDNTDRVLVCSGDDGTTESDGQYRRLKRSPTGATMNGVGDFKSVRNITMSGTINGFQIVSQTKIKSGGSNVAMTFLSSNAKYNFRDAGDTENTGQIQAGNVTFRSLSRITGDETDPANFDEEGNYIGPVQDLLSIIETLQQRVTALESA